MISENTPHDLVSNKIDYLNYFFLEKLQSIYLAYIPNWEKISQFQHCEWESQSTFT